jgi:hypothetical protein
MVAAACLRNTRRALCAIFTTPAGRCVRAFLRTLANVPSQCRKVHADRENSCMARAVNDKRAVNDSFAIQDRRHLLSPRTNLRVAGRVVNRASKDANGRQHGICSHQGCDPSHHAWRQLSFEHTSQPTVRLIETTNGRRHLPSVFGFRGAGRWHPARRATSDRSHVCAALPSTWVCAPASDALLCNLYNRPLCSSRQSAPVASIRSGGGPAPAIGGPPSPSRACLVSKRRVE